MAVNRKSLAQFFVRLRDSILSRTQAWDTGYGPLPDQIMTPVSAVLEDFNNNNLRPVSLLLSLENVAEFSEADLNGIAYNEEIVRPSGSNATTTLTFRRNVAFGSGENGTIARGTPIGTSIDESSGQQVTFVTTEARDKTFSVAVINASTNTTIYEVSVPAICLLTGSAGKVGPNRITRPLRPLSGYSSVTNKVAALEGRERYSNAELAELLLLAVSSRQLSVPTGSEFYVRDTFPTVEDVHEVFGTNPLITRAAETAGAVDSFVIGETALQATELKTFYGIGQKMSVSLPPVISIDSVVGVGGASDGVTFTENVDYDVRLDTSGVSGSTRALDGIRFLPGAAIASGDAANITYTYNQVIRDLQADSTDEEVEVEGRDLLFRQGERLELYLSATMTVRTGFLASSIQDLVEAAIDNAVNAYGLGDDGEASDIQGIVRVITGVDNFVITRFTDNVAGTTVEEPITVSASQYLRLDRTNLVITPVSS